MDESSSFEIIIGDLKSSSIDDSSRSSPQSGNQIESNTSENISSKSHPLIL